jgi:hypothetical protein
VDSMAPVTVKRKKILPPLVTPPPLLACTVLVRPFTADEAPSRVTAAVLLASCRWLKDGHLKAVIC